MSLEALARPLIAIVAVALVGAASWHAEAAMPSGVVEPFAGAPVFADHELVQMRGGLAAPFGLEIEFGVLTRTLIDGETVFQTMLSFGPDGASVGPAALASLEHAVPGLALSADQVSFAVGPGAVFTDGNGTVTGIVQATPDKVLNLLAAMGVDQRIDQQLNLIFAVKGFAGLQDGARAAEAANRLLSLTTQP
jgi:hypothetical protein